MKIGNYSSSKWWFITSKQGAEMDAETIKRKQSALKTLLRQFDIPAMRSDVTQPANLRWLTRNLAAKNKDHAMFDTAMAMVRWLLRADRKVA